MEKFNAREFLATRKGQAILIIGLSLIGLIAMYFIFRSKPEDSGSKTIGADTEVMRRDTTFKARGNAYTEYESKGKKMETDKDFFKGSTEELKSAISDSSVKKNSNEDLQRMADSILRANQTKVSYGQAAGGKKTSYGGGRTSSSSSASYYSTVSKVDKERQRQQELERFQKENKESFKEFFQGANDKKEPKGNSGFSQNSGKNVLPSDAMIYAELSGDQLVKNKDRVLLKLKKDALINGEVYRKNTLIYATAAFTNNRVNLNITNINQKPVTLTAHDAEDGNKGIYIAGQSLVAETVDEATTDAVRDIDIKGIPVGKTIKRVFSKKQREPQVQLLNKYGLILKTE